MAVQREKVEEPNDQSQQTVRLNINEQALLVQFHPNQNLNRHPNASLSKIVLGPFIANSYLITRSQQGLYNSP